MKKLWIALLLWHAGKIHAQYTIDPGFSTSSVLISFPGIASGSGFMYLDSNYLYLVTAHHVLFRRDSIGRISDVPVKKQFLLVAYSDSLDIASRNEFIIDMPDMQRQGYVLTDPVNDICILVMGKNNGGKIYYHTMIQKMKIANSIRCLRANNIRLFDQLQIGEDAYIFGYPQSIGLRGFRQFDYEQPLLRKGSIAGKYQRLRTVILDCPVNHGNSGGPVFTIDGNGFVRLIGLVTQLIPYEEHNVYNNRKVVPGLTTVNNSSYSVVVPVEGVLRMVGMYCTRKKF